VIYGTSIFHNFLNDELLQGLTVEELRGLTWPVSHKNMDAQTWVWIWNII